jgi:beta-lactam-binding protein with PASTA domain
MRGKKRTLITVLTALAFIVYVLIPGIALVALRLDVQRERRMRPTQIQVPAVKGLSYEDAETKLRASNLNIRLLATRSDLPLQPGLVIDQIPQPGEKVDSGYAVAVTVTKRELTR